MHWWVIKLIWLIYCNLSVYWTLRSINITLTVLHQHITTILLFVIFTTFSVTRLSAVNIHIIFLIKCIMILHHNWLIIWMCSTSRFSWFLRCSSGLSSRVCCRIVHKTILWNILHYGIIMGIISRIDYGASMRSLTDLIMMLRSF